jgi:hypothetical protein
MVKIKFINFGDKRVNIYEYDLTCLTIRCTLVAHGMMICVHMVYFHLFNYIMVIRGSMHG